MNGVSGRLVALERVEVEAGHVHVLWLCRNVQSVKPAPNAAVKSGVDFSSAHVPEVSQGLAAERLDHLESV